jgi:nucleoid DNA-binding protein
MAVKQEGSRRTEARLSRPPSRKSSRKFLARPALTKKDIGAVFEELNSIIKKSLKSASEFSMPGLMKVRVVKKPATKARLGKNPFTGEEITIKAKPARKTVKVTALKGLKDMV